MGFSHFPVDYFKSWCAVCVISQVQLEKGTKWIIWVPRVTLSLVNWESLLHLVTPAWRSLHAEYLKWLWILKVSGSLLCPLCRQRPRNILIKLLKGIEEVSLVGPWLMYLSAFCSQIHVFLLKYVIHRDLIYHLCLYPEAWPPHPPFQILIWANDLHMTLASFI